MEDKLYDLIKEIRTAQTEQLAKLIKLEINHENLKGFVKDIKKDFNTIETDIKSIKETDLKQTQILSDQAKILKNHIRRTKANEDAVSLWSNELIEMKKEFNISIHLLSTENLKKQTKEITKFNLIKQAKKNISWIILTIISLYTMYKNLFF